MGFFVWHDIYSKTNLDFLKENISKRDLDKKLKEYTNSSKFTKKVKTIVDKEKLSDKELEDKIIDVSKNAMSQLFKILWMKRNFWKTNIKNKP